MNQKGRGRHADALMKPGKYSKQNMFGIQALVEKFAEANLVCSGETHQRRRIWIEKSTSNDLKKVP